MTEQMRALLAAFGGDAMKLYKSTGILLPIAGGAKGYNQTDDLLLNTVDGVPLEELYREFIASVNLLNGQRSPLIQSLSFQVTDPFEEIMPIIAEDFEEADEFGQPKGIRLGTPWNMGYDLKYMDIGIRYTFRFLGRASAEQVRALNSAALDADQRLVLKTVLERIFRNITDSATLEGSGRVVTVYPFYNGDQTALPVAPPAWKTYSHTTSHTHYLSAGGTLDSADLDSMYEHIYHHGYAQGGSPFLLVNRQESKIIRTFRVSTGSAYDFIPAQGTPGAIFLGTLVGSLPSGATPPGAPSTFPGVVGYYGPWTIVEEDYMPPGYLLGYMSGGRFNDRNPVGIREHENAALRGLKLIPQFERYPLRESFYHHAIGSGVRHPAAGVVMQVASAPYVIPSLSLNGQGGR